jgi:hypothetical protein
MRPLFSSASRYCLPPSQVTCEAVTMLTVFVLLAIVISPMVQRNAHEADSGLPVVTGPPLEHRADRGAPPPVGRRLRTRLQ